MPRHEEQKTLAYTADELFAVVADVKASRPSCSTVPTGRLWQWPVMSRQRSRSRPSMVSHSLT